MKGKIVLMNEKEQNSMAMVKDHDAMTWKWQIIINELGLRIKIEFMHYKSIGQAIHFGLRRIPVVVFVSIIMCHWIVCQSNAKELNDYFMILQFYKHQETSWHTADVFLLSELVTNSLLASWAPFRKKTNYHCRSIKCWVPTVGNNIWADRFLYSLSFQFENTEKTNDTKLNSTKQN